MFGRFRYGVKGKNDGTEEHLRMGLQPAGCRLLRTNSLPFSPTRKNIWLTQISLNIVHHDWWLVPRRSVSCCFFSEIKEWLVEFHYAILGIHTLPDLCGCDKVYAFSVYKTKLI